MPTYVYRCKACSHEFEELQRTTDESLTECPSCGKTTLKRMIGGGGGLVFKGSGFYLTDYKKSGGDGKKESSEKKETKPEAKTETKSETKTETKSSDSGSSKPKSDSKE